MQDRFFFSQSPLKAEDRLARTRKSHLKKRMVCVSKTLAVGHLVSLGPTLAGVSNFDPLIFFYCSEGMKMFVIT